MSLLINHRQPARTLYDTVSEASAAAVIRGYSSSFAMASRLFAEPVRTRVRNVYALVRVADEIVDNPDARVDLAARDRMLAWLQEDLGHALSTGYSSNLVVHAFTRTAVECGIGLDLVEPFFDSMRMDLTTTTHDDVSLDRYVYGSAEVVGLMCLRVFLADSDVPHSELADGARRLGAAFQKVNFLRDLAEDHDLLGRSYFPALRLAEFCDADRDRLLADIDADLSCAAATIPRLPLSSRRAVRAAHAIFRELADRLRVTPAAQLRRTRVRVPGPVKARILAGALVGDRS